MPITRDDATRSQRVGVINQARGGATIEIRTENADGLSDSTGTLLAILQAPTTWGFVTNGVLTANPIPPAAALADGLAGHYLIKKGDNVIESGNIPQDGFILDDPNLVAGKTVRLSTWVTIEPNQQN